MTSIRLSPEIEKNLEIIADSEHKSKTDIIKKAITEFINQYYSSSKPYELGKNLFGKYGSGVSDNSLNYKSKIKRKLNDKFSH